MSRPLRILFLSDNFPPESNAPANRTFEHCKEWVQLGADVTVITCNPNFPKGKVYSGYSNSIYREEILGGIKVVRVWSYITPNRGTLKRILDYISFGISAFLASLFYKTDIIVATSPQLFTAVGGYMASVIKRKPWIMEIRDLWPESIKAVDAMNSSSILDRLQGLVNFLYKNATHLVVVTDSFKRQIIAEADIKQGRISVIKNGVNADRFSIRQKNDVLAVNEGLSDKFVIGYIGTHGMAHNLDFILDCAQKVDDPAIHFLFIGDGAYKNRMIKKLVDLGLSNVTMLDPVSRDTVPDYISIIDVALIPLKKSETFRSVIPSKIFENAASGKPILLGVEGEAEEIVSSYGAGVCFEPENEEDFLSKLYALKNDKSLFHKCQEGCVQLAKDFNRQTLAQQMLEVITDVARGETVDAEVRSKEVALQKKIMVFVLDIILIAVVAIVLYMLFD